MADQSSRTVFTCWRPIQYEFRGIPVITLSFPNNEIRREGYNSLTALDYTINGSNFVSATFHMADQHIRYANMDFFNPQQVSPNTANNVYSADVTEHASFKGTLLESALTAASFRTGVWPQGNEDMTLTPEGNTGNYFAQQTPTSSRVEMARNPGRFRSTFWARTTSP